MTLLTLTLHRSKDLLSRKRCHATHRRLVVRSSHTCQIEESSYPRIWPQPQWRKATLVPLLTFTVKPDQELTFHSPYVWNVQRTVQSWWACAKWTHIETAVSARHSRVSITESIWKMVQAWSGPVEMMYTKSSQARDSMMVMSFNYPSLETGWPFTRISNKWL